MPTPIITMPKLTYIYFCVGVFHIWLLLEVWWIIKMVFLLMLPRGVAIKLETIRKMTSGAFWCWLLLTASKKVLGSFKVINRMLLRKGYPRGHTSGCKNAHLSSMHRVMYLPYSIHLGKKYYSQKSFKSLKFSIWVP